MFAALRTVCSSFALAVPLLAQVVRVVDAAGSPGSFPTLAAAEAASANGDTILVLPTGLYDFALTTSKGLTILGQGPASPTFRGRLVVANLPTGQQFVLRNFTTNVYPQVGWLGIDHCAGRVVLENLVLAGPGSGTGFGQGLGVIASHDVSMNLSACTGNHAVTVYESRFVASDCQFVGEPASVLSIGGLGLAAYGSEVWLTRCALSGPPAALELSPSTGLPSWATMAGGSVASGSATAPVAVVVPGSLLRVDATTVLTGAVGGLFPGALAPFESGRAYLGLLPPGVTSGANFEGPTGAFGALALALPGPPMPTPIGILFADAANYVIVAAGIVPVSVTFMLPAGVPSALPLLAQGVLLHQNTLRLSPPLRTLTP
ncbi:MAG: hypothetical protein WAT39_10190 [Planctomycetota bacterium]